MILWAWLSKTSLVFQVSLSEPKLHYLVSWNYLELSLNVRTIDENRNSDKHIDVRMYMATIQILKSMADDMAIYDCPR